MTGQLTFDVKSVLHLSRRVLLGHKHGVKVPKGRFDKAVGRHLGESDDQLLRLSILCVDVSCLRHQGPSPFPPPPLALLSRSASS